VYVIRPDNRDVRVFIRTFVTLLLIGAIQPGTFHTGAIQPGSLQAAPLSKMEVGYASWYGGKFQGRQTASGEKFDTKKLTAAHKTLPFGKIVRVTNLENNLSVEVRINDRGPFIEGRIIDLSRAAADVIGMAGKGIALVKVEPVETEKNQNLDREIYTIQIGAYRIRENAMRARQRAEKSGLEVKLEIAPSKVIRVLVSNVTAGKLQEVKSLLRANGFEQTLVRRYRAPGPKVPGLEVPGLEVPDLKAPASIIDREN